MFCLSEENIILKSSKLNNQNKNIDVDEFDEYDDMEIAENTKENIISQHFSAITPRNTSIAKSLDLLNLFVKNISVHEKFTNLFNHMSENVNPVEIMIKQKFYEFTQSLELPNDCLTSFARIINAMQKSELWAFECEFH
jgi:hypothetical protein